MKVTGGNRLLLGKKIQVNRRFAEGLTMEFGGLNVADALSGILETNLGKAGGF